MSVVALVLGFGLLARLILNMRSQNRLLLEDVRALDRNVTVTRAHCAALIRRVKRHRDAALACLDQAGDEYQELSECHDELLRETAAYRAEDARREAAAREKRARLN